MPQPLRNVTEIYLYVLSNEVSTTISHMKYA